jgi:predicted phage terminase large subunit-like protein
VTGQGFDLLIIDDPVKSREEAESETFRDKVWDWFRDDLYTRCEPGAAIIVIMTRWHEDDLVGRILASEDAGEWTVINLPAIAEEDDPIGREVGEALCPARFDVSALEQIRRVLGGYSFDALYQGRPSAKAGSFFKVGMLEIVDAAPVNLRVCRAWDVAATENDGDYTAGVQIGTGDDGYFYVTDVVRGQWSTDNRNRTMRQSAETDGTQCSVRVPQDAGAAGVDAARMYVRLLQGFRVETVRPTGDKATRAEPFSAQFNAGNVRLVRGAWNRAYIEELRAFPQGKYDDQVDASSDAFNALVTRRQGKIA